MAVMSKPSQEQINKIKTTFKVQDTKFCLKENDTNHIDFVQWIQCESCLLWLHLSCTVPKLNVIPQNYICHFCNN